MNTRCPALRWKGKHPVKNPAQFFPRSEEHTSELQSRGHFLSPPALYPLSLHDALPISSLPTEPGFFLCIIPKVRWSIQDRSAALVPSSQARDFLHTTHEYTLSGPPVEG